MVTQEMVQAQVQELQRRAAELQREHRAREAMGRSVPPRNGPSLAIIGRMPLARCLARAFRASPAS